VLIKSGSYTSICPALLALHPPISPLTSLGQHNRASWASQPQKSVTLLPCPGGKTTKSTRTCVNLIYQSASTWLHYNVLYVLLTEHPCISFFKSLILTSRPDSYPYRAKNTSVACRIDIAGSPDDGHIVVRNMYRS